MSLEKQPHFHSQYNPVKEAERFIEVSLKDKKPGIIVVMGPGENYIKAVLDVRYPYARKYYVQPCTIFDTQSYDSLYWSPGSPVSLKDFFHQLLFDEYAVAGIAVLEWEPVTRAFPEVSKQIRNEIARILATTASDRATTSYWSKKWFINSVRFYRNAENFQTIKPLSAPIAIIGAGPGLMDYKTKIKQIHPGCFILAIASSLPFLLENNIQPDAVLLSDPGFWNIYHTRALLDLKIPIAMPPSARISPQLYNKPMLVLDTNLIFEQLVIDALKCPSSKVQAFGTSVGTAIDLALKLTTGNVYIFGFDLAANDLITHCLPYAFSSFALENTSRLKPYYALMYSDVAEKYPEKSGLWRFSRSFSTYAQELSISDGELKRIKRYSSSPMFEHNNILREITESPDILDPWDTDSFERSDIFSKVAAPIKTSISQVVFSFLDKVLAKLQTSNAFSLSFNEIVFLKAFSPKALNTILALSVRQELTPSKTECFIDECGLEASRCIEQYC